jgi:hypothetical protein
MMRLCWPARPVASGARFPRHFSKPQAEEFLPGCRGKPYGEPQLGRRGLYPLSGGQSTAADRGEDLDTILCFS